MPCPDNPVDPASMRPRVFPAEDAPQITAGRPRLACFNEAAGIPRGRRRRLRTPGSPPVGFNENVFEYEPDPDPHYIERARRIATEVVRSKGFLRIDWPTDAAAADVRTLFDYVAPRPSQRGVCGSARSAAAARPGQGRRRRLSCVSLGCGVLAPWTVCTLRCRRVLPRSNCTVEYAGGWTDSCRRPRMFRPFLRYRAISSPETRKGAASRSSKCCGRTSPTSRRAWHAGPRRALGSS